MTRVQIKPGDDGEIFLCDEEPIVLGPEQGFGYYPLTLGEKFDEGGLEIVRKLDWGSCPSVWLARAHECVIY